MKACVIGTRGFPFIEGGVEKHCESLYPLLRNDIDVVVYRRKTYVNIVTTYDNISFVDLPSTRIKGFEAVFHSFLATVHALIMKPDIVHYHNIGPALFAPILKLRKISVVLTYHSPNYEHKKWGKFARYILMFSEKVALKYSERIIFVNSFQMEKYTTNIRKKSVFIPNGIHKPVISQNTNYLQDIGIVPGKYVLSVGRITQEKGFDTLIKGFKKSNHEGYKLVIAGGVEFENGYMQELIKLSENDDVVFTGYVFGDNLAQIYTNAALYVLASNNEGFPLVLLEAMSYSLDVLVSDIPATHLVKLENDDYFGKGDYRTLSNKISERLIKPYSREYDLKECDWNTVAEEVATVYDQVIKPSIKVRNGDQYENIND